MRHNRWPTDALGNRRLSATVPLDDEHNHMMRAFAYLVVAKFPPTPPPMAARADPWDERGEDYVDETYGSLSTPRALCPTTRRSEGRAILER
jgi:hypothetical protein